jgi:protein-S-isoprenylcysteine O-methyltransferase Ste14
MLFEEPALERKSGASYEEYLKSVPRWMRRRGGVHPRDAAE